MSARENQRQKLLTRRAALLAGGQAVLGGALAARMYQLQIIDKDKASNGMKTTVNLGSGLIAGFAAAIVSQPADTMLSKINKTKGLPGEGTTSRLIKIAKELGLPVSTDMPQDMLDLLELFPQPLRTSQSVEFGPQSNTGRN